MHHESRDDEPPYHFQLQNKLQVMIHDISYHSPCDIDSVLTRTPNVNYLVFLRFLAHNWLKIRH
jgi:hypothetical protein